MLPLKKFRGPPCYREARAKAPKRPDPMTNEIANLSTSEKDIQEAADEWGRQFEIDRLIYAERVMIHNVWQQAKAKKAQSGQQHLSLNIQTPTRPEPRDPPMHTSFDLAQRHPRASLPSSPLGHLPNQPMSAGDLHNSLLIIQQGMISTTELNINH